MQRKLTCTCETGFPWLSLSCTFVPPRFEINVGTNKAVEIKSCKFFQQLIYDDIYSLFFKDSSVQFLHRVKIKNTAIVLQCVTFMLRKTLLDNRTAMKTDKWFQIKSAE